MWRSFALQPNVNYTPYGADQPCPATATLNGSAGSTTIECVASGFLEFRSDGATVDVVDYSPTRKQRNESPQNKFMLKTAAVG